MEVDESDHEEEEVAEEDAAEDAEDQENALPEGQNAENHPSSSQQQSYRPQETRLVINKMVLENFKSYAGKQEIGPLHHCFSAVVGPNGSGKSNVIDAVLFVFGRQAKKLRLNKVSEFIHNSEHQRNLSAAKVSVHFEEIYVSDDATVSRPVPGSKFVLTRTARADNSSEYFLDTKKVKREDVVALLKKKGVDLDNSRFLILQGEVEQISLMKPKGANPNETGLVDYLEEIIGSNKYIEDIDAMTKSVDELTEERRGKIARVDVAEKECKRLEGAKDEAESCILKQRELLDQQALLAQLHMIKERTEIEGDTEKKRKAEKGLREHQEAMNSKIEAAKKTETEWKKKNKEYEQLGEELESAKKEWSSYERRDASLRGDISSLEDSIKTIENNIKAAKKNASESKNTHKQLTEDVQKLEQEKAGLEEKLETAQEELDRLEEEVRSATAPLVAKLEAIKTKQMPQSQESKRIETKLDFSRNELNRITERAQVAKRQVEQAEEEIARLTEHLANLRDAPGGNRGAAEERRKDAEKKQAQIGQLQAQEMDLTARMSGLQQQRAELDSANQQSRESNAVSAIMKDKASGKLPGVYGRLGDLGFIEDKYDTAITTACPALNNIVVDTPETATKCVELLRAKNLGRATFIILDKVGPANAKAASASFQAPAGSNRLFDLVKVNDPALRPAFYFALRDTLVAESFDVGRKIAYGGRGYRVVTLAGDLFERSGTMSGGGTTKLSGGMRNQKNFVDPKETEQQMKKIASEMEKLGTQREKIRSELATLRDDIVRLQREAAQIESESKKAEFEVRSLTMQLEQLNKRLPDLKKDAKTSAEDTAKMQSLSADIKKLEKDFAEIQKVLSQHNSEITSIQDQIKEVEGTDVKVQRSRVESLKERIQALSNSQSAASQKATRASKKAAEMETAREEAEKEMVTVNKKLEKKKAELEVLVQEAVGVFAEFERRKKAFEEHNDSISDLRTQVDEAKVEVAELRREEAKLADEVNKIKKVMDEREARIKDNESRLARLKREKLQTKIDDETDESLEIPTVDENSEYDESEIIKQLNVLKQELAASEPDRAAIRAWRERKKVLEERQAELDEVSKKRDETKKRLDELRKKRFEEFMTGFNVISGKLREMYRMITLGGDAELEVIDVLDPFSEGVNFTVRPPGKSWKKIQNLSGGEKTLSSLSLVFALHYYKPTPIYIMDEIDAALDFKNVSIVANYIKERTKNAQFLIVSLRNYMFELADRLVGIYKTDNCTKSVTINPHAFTVQQAQN
eukprot:TRINITY_DN13421_c0_g1_i1.p1 TRINITY_DN13421_c0_g1~~TRINITY_DN13421_c0_g1_i1.p1  ORF type:complete len:1298 (-),score=460.87 TRINITY_DN13421_c0_g1_i1:81-3887(-)